MARGPSPVAYLRAAPILVPCLAVLPVLTWWAADDAGFAVTAWSPGLLWVLALLAVALVVIPNAWGDVPRAVALAVALLGAYTAWSYATILWADEPGQALEGANRTLLYFALFALFALWRQRTRTAEVLVTFWTLSVVGVAAVTAARLAAVADPRRFFAVDRLATPVDYPNAAAATFAMALWPAIVLAGAARVNVAVRAACAGGAVLLVDLALLAESRGALLAMPLTGLLCLAVVPGRLRTLAVLAGVGLGVAVSATPVLDVSGALTASGSNPSGAIAEAAVAMLVAGVVVGAVAGAVAWWEQHHPPSVATQARLRRGGQAAAAVVVLVTVVGGAVLAGNPIDRLDHAWDSFRGGYGDGSGASSRLVSGLGSNRYDFYRVALDEFSTAPLIGHGGENFQQAYLRAGDSTETPRYPHSVELRTLSETGAIGTVLLLGALLAAAWGAWAGMRSARGEDVTVAADRALRGAVGGAALMAFAYVLVHGSADWFWETAGLSAPAFALLGLSAGLAPRPDPPRGLVTRARTPLELLPLVAVLLAALVVVGAPWLSAVDVDRASDVFATRPLEAYDRLDRAGRLNPLSDRPALLEGSIAERYGDLPRARAAFGTALDRVPDGESATLQLGALASFVGNVPQARAMLTRAVELAPRDAVAKEALAVVIGGGRIDLDNLNRRILEGTATFTGG